MQEQPKPPVFRKNGRPVSGRSMRPQQEWRAERQVYACRPADGRRGATVASGQANGGHDKAYVLAMKEKEVYTARGSGKKSIEAVGAKPRCCAGQRQAHLLYLHKPPQEPGWGPGPSPGQPSLRLEQARHLPLQRLLVPLRGMRLQRAGGGGQREGRLAAL